MPLRPSVPNNPDTPTRTDVPALTPKHCNCCGADYDATQWLTLAYRGVLDSDVETLELRDCPCGSTLAIVTWTNLDSEEK